MDRLTENEALETLLLRLADGHPQRMFLENRLYRTAGGKRGEARLQSRFKEFWIDGDFKVLWDVSLALGDWKVQLDGILLTERCALVIESKNISGEIHFNEATGEFFRLNMNGEKTVLKTPASSLANTSVFSPTGLRSTRFLCLSADWQYSLPNIANSSPNRLAPTSAKPTRCRTTY